MVENIEIPISHLWKYVEFAFEDDEELVGKYNKRVDSLGELIKTNVKYVIELSESVNVTCYKVVYDGLVIGFMVTAFSGSLLYSFGINKKYRVKEILIQWINLIKKGGREYIAVTLNEENQRAIDFFIKNDFIIICS